MRVEFSLGAQGDLIAIFDYLRPLNPRAARRIVNELEKRCRSLSRYSKRGAPVLNRRGTPLRRLVVDQYLIFYEVMDDMVFIDAVVHGAQDYEHFLELRTSAAKND
jgi:toxin ParE1/3/4